MSVIDPLYHQLDADIHWICRSDFTPMLSTHPKLFKIWSYKRTSGLWGLIQIVALLRREKFDYVYDAHQNVRSFIVRLFLGMVRFQSSTELTVRRKHRWKRFLFFQLNIRKAIPVPFRAVVSFQKPLLKWGIDFSNHYETAWYFSPEIEEKGKKILCTILEESKVVTIVPSAAWELKRWPVAYWQDLVRLLPDFRFIIIAGPEDTFTQEIEAVDPKRVFNLAGKTNLQESFYVISKSQIVISADTGFLHAADLFRRNAIALMGPTAFGHPTGKTVRVLEVSSLKCRPCTKAGNTVCKLPEASRACLLDLKPKLVIELLHEMIP